jgi:AcrR family transcriptional regulator
MEARRSLIESGYDDLSLRGVADRLGIALGNLQYYFPTRDELVLEVIRAEASADLETMRATVGLDASPRSHLERLVYETVSTWRGESGVLYMTLSFLALHRDAFRTEYRRVYKTFYEPIERAIERAEPGHPKSEYRQRARLLTALMDGAAMQVQVGPHDRYLRSIVDAALAIVAPGITPAR